MKDRRDSKIAELRKDLKFAQVAGMAFMERAEEFETESRRLQVLLRAAGEWAVAFRAYWAFKGVTSTASLKAHSELETAERQLLVALDSSQSAICTQREKP